MWKKEVLKERSHPPQSLINTLYFRTERHDQRFRIKSCFNVLIQPILILSKGKREKEREGEREKMEVLVSWTAQCTSHPSSRPHVFNLMGHSANFTF